MAAHEPLRSRQHGDDVVVTDEATEFTETLQRRLSNLKQYLSRSV